MDAFHIVQAGEAWVWRLQRGDEPIAQGILYADVARVQRDLQHVCEGDAPPTVFAVTPDRWAWAFARFGQRLGTTLVTYPDRDAAFDACVKALDAGRRAARTGWVWPVAEVGAPMLRGPSSSRADR